jgi:uncharacterized protein YbcV (DUF1398 family)
MFTKEQIHEAFIKVKSGADFPQFVKDLKTLGVVYYDNFVSDGRTVYYGRNNFVIEGEPKYPEIKVYDTSSSSALKHAILIHQQGQTDYPKFCLQAAESGVEKWTTHMEEMTVTYYDKQGNKLSVEPIPIS